MNVETTTNIIPKIQKYFLNQPIDRAWLFGSFSRGEENENSDVDLLVTFTPSAKVGLFTYSSILIGLKKLLDREVDLVKEGTLLPFAVDSANKDKVLIYERENQRRNKA